VPQPIDINSELGRTTVAQRVQEIADRASLAAQQRQAQQVQQEQVNAETVVQHPAESGQDSAIGDRRHNEERQRRGRDKEAAGNEPVMDEGHGAGDLAVLPDSEQHRLDIHV
jgi:hypothetical protein